MKNAHEMLQTPRSQRDDDANNLVLPAFPELRTLQIRPEIELAKLNFFC
jgi:hypothetical protein